MTDDAANAGALLRYIVKFKDGVKEPPAAQLYYPDTEYGRAKAEQFARQHDEKGFSVYSCIGRLRGTPRNKANVAELGNLVLDLDLRNIIESREQVIACLRELPLPPEIRDSGRGLHAIWPLKEPLVDEAGMAEAETTMRRLVTLLAGDPKPTHRAALLRHLGTHNSRNGEWLECRVLESGKPCDITEFADMFDLYGDTALLHYKKEAAAPFDSEGKRLPIDLEAMRYQGNPGMHDTFLGYMGSRLSYGDTVADIIERAVEAAGRHCADDPNRPKWRHDLAGKATWWLEKHPEWIDTGLSAKHAQAWLEAEKEGRRPSIIWKNGPGLEVRTFGLHDNNGASDKEQGARSTQQDPHTDAPKVKFKLIQFSNLRPGMDEQPYLVDERIPAAGLVIIWGKPKCFKSFLTLDMMLHVAKGWEWHDRAVRQGSVVYCAFEGAHGYKKRIAALRLHYELADDDPAPLFVMPGNANLIAEHRTLIRDIQTQLNDTKPSAVVLDTLNKSLHGSESKDTDMSAYIRAAEAIRDTFGSVVVIVHHCGLDETRPRGHTSLPGAVDVQAAVMREGLSVTMEIEYMRDGPEGTIVSGNAEIIDVGIDGNGKTLTSLVIVPVDKPTEVHKRKDWPRSLRIFRDALSEAILTNGVDYQVENGPRVRATNLENVRAAFYKTYIPRGDDRADKEQLQNARRQAFGRCVERAQGMHLIGVRVLPDERQLIWQAVSHYGEA